MSVFSLLFFSPIYINECVYKNSIFVNTWFGSSKYQLTYNLCTVIQSTCALICEVQSLSNDSKQKVFIRKVNGIVVYERNWHKGSSIGCGIFVSPVVSYPVETRYERCLVQYAWMPGPIRRPNYIISRNFRFQVSL